MYGMTRPFCTSTKAPPEQPRIMEHVVSSCHFCFHIGRYDLCETFFWGHTQDISLPYIYPWRRLHSMKLLSLNRPHFAEVCKTQAIAHQPPLRNQPFTLFFKYNVIPPHSNITFLHLQLTNIQMYHAMFHTMFFIRPTVVTSNCGMARVVRPSVCQLTYGSVLE